VSKLGGFASPWFSERGGKKQRQMLQLKSGFLPAAVALVWLSEGACLSSFFCSSLPFLPSLTWLGCISDPIPVSSPLLLTWERTSSLQELAAFYAQLVINFFLPSFLLPFQTLSHNGHSPQTSPFVIPVIPVFTAEHCSGCRYFPHSISQKWALVIDSLPVPSVPSKWGYEDAK